MSYFEDEFERMLYRDPFNVLYKKNVYYNNDEYINQQVKIKCLKAGVWLSADGPIQISEMTDSHIQNALNLVKRRQRDEVDTLAIEILQKEIDRRKTEKWIF